MSPTPPADGDGGGNLIGDGRPNLKALQIDSFLTRERD
jgi:hypothetical protein